MSEEHVSRKIAAIKALLLRTHNRLDVARLEYYLARRELQLSYLIFPDINDEAHEPLLERVMRAKAEYVQAQVEEFL